MTHQWIQKIRQAVCSSWSMRWRGVGRADRDTVRKRARSVESDKKTGWIRQPSVVAQAVSLSTTRDVCSEHEGRETLFSP